MLSVHCDVSICQFCTIYLLVGSHYLFSIQFWHSSKDSSEWSSQAPSPTCKTDHEPCQVDVQPAFKWLQPSLHDQTHLENVPPASALLSAYQASVSHGACNSSVPVPNPAGSVTMKSKVLFRAFYLEATNARRQTWAKAQLETLGFRSVLLTTHPDSPDFIFSFGLRQHICRP
jgi:hypothetical protein